MADVAAVTAQRLLDRVPVAVSDAIVAAEDRRFQGHAGIDVRGMIRALSVDLRAKGITGKDAEAALGRVHITVNKNAIPNDPERPMVTSGVRIGSPAMTTRGFRKPEAERLADLIADVLDRPGDDANLARVANEVKALCARFPVYA